MNQFRQQARQMQEKMALLQRELEASEMDISSGGGMVKIKITGKQEILDLQLNKECVDPDDVELLQELLKTAINQSIKESQEMVKNSMSKVTGGINIPGLF